MSTRPQSPASDYVTLAEVLELTRPLAEFEAAGQALARRLEAESVQELVMMQLYTRPGSNEAGVVLTFSDRQSILRHIAMISGWEEFKRFGGTVRLSSMRVYGQLGAEAQAWVRQFGGGEAVSAFETHVAGFAR